MKEELEDTGPFTIVILAASRFKSHVWPGLSNKANRRYFNFTDRIRSVIQRFQQIQRVKSRIKRLNL